MQQPLLNAVLLWGLALFAVSCSDPSPDAALTGRWQGTEARAEFQPDGSPVAVYEENVPDFDIIIEFHEDGTVAVEDDGVTTTGTWAYTDGKNKIIAAVDLQNEYLGASETFTIERLTAGTLVLYFEKDGDFEIPDFGNVSGKLSMTLQFDRLN